MAPYPPTPLIIGSTTFGGGERPPAASKAFPPSSRISSPARVASGCAELTIPFVPTAGLLAVFLLAGPSTGLSSRADSGVVGPVVSVEGRAFCVVSPVPSFTRDVPSSPILDRALQEHRAASKRASRRILTLSRSISSGPPAGPNRFPDWATL